MILKSRSREKTLHYFSYITTPEKFETYIKFLFNKNFSFPSEVIDIIFSYLCKGDFIYGVLQDKNYVNVLIEEFPEKKYTSRLIGRVGDIWYTNLTPIYINSTNRRLVSSRNHWYPFKTCKMCDYSTPYYQSDHYKENATIYSFDFPSYKGLDNNKTWYWLCFDCCRSRLM